MQTITRALLIGLMVLGVILMLTSATAQAAPPNSPPRAPHVAGDEFWGTFQSPIGVSGVGTVEVRAIAVDGDTIYIGGLFTSAANVTVNNIAMFRNGMWSALGSGLNDEVYALAVDTNHILYAGGKFYQSGDGLQPLYSIAKWNGSAWSPLGPGLAGWVLALVVDGGNNVYAAGTLTKTMDNLTTLTHIGKWNGSTWSAMGSGLDNATHDGYVNALAISGSNVYAGGQFTATGDNLTLLTRIARWDSGTWSALGTGFASTVLAIVADGAGKVYASTSGNEIKKWESGSWASLGSVNGAIYSLALDAGGMLYAGGSFSNIGSTTLRNVAKYDGTWHPLDGGLGGSPDSVYAIVPSGSRVYAGGHFGTSTGGATALNHVANWNGTRWGTFGGGMNGQVNALATFGNNVYAGGAFNSPATYLAVWDGFGWAGLDTLVETIVHAIAVDSSGNVYSDGFSGGLPGSIAGSVIKRWNAGTRTWTQLGSGADGQVRALAVDSGGTLYAAGDFVHAPNVLINQIVNRVAKLVSGNWAAVGNGVNNSVYALKTVGTNVYAGGMFQQVCGNSACNSGNTTANRIAVWNGSNWSQVGNGTGNTVMALAAIGTDIYAGGNFTNAFNPGGGNVGALYIAKWNGSNWATLGNGLNNWVWALASSGSSLYAGGDLTSANNTGGSVTVNHIAKWDGTNWSALGSGTNTAVFAVAAHGSTLYAGGTFTTAGGKPSSRIGRWMPPNYPLFLPLIQKAP
ncbi:MAG: hypothetical protein HY782_08935 [Chloroflexi bacterium]|nr:hypothetical protein [Chloroflexota bacterium]